MRKSVILSAAFAALFILGNDSKAQSIESFGASSESELASAFRAAHDRRDLNAMLKLFYWEKVTPEIRRSTEKAIEESFDDGISVLRTSTEHPKGRMNEFVRDGVTYGFNLEIVEELVMETADPKSGSATTYYPVGTWNGRYFIAQMAPGATSRASRRMETISPASPSFVTQASNAPKRKIALPAKTSISVRLDQIVGMDLIASGGRFTARVNDPVQINGVTAIPSGSAVVGIVKKDASYSPQITLESIDIDGQAYRLKTFPITFNQRISYPAGSEVNFQVMFDLTIAVP